MTPEEYLADRRNKNLELTFLALALVLVGFLIFWVYGRMHRDCASGATLNQGGYSFACSDEGKWVQVQ